METGSILSTDNVTVSAGDISVSAGDISVSTKDISVSPGDISISTKIYGWSVSGKRKTGDEGDWWLPSGWRSPWRARWPSSPSTSSRRRGGWSISTDPGRVVDL